MKLQCNELLSKVNTKVCDENVKRVNTNFQGGEKREHSGANMKKKKIQKNLQGGKHSEVNFYLKYTHQKKNT